MFEYHFNTREVKGSKWSKNEGGISRPHYRMSDDFSGTWNTGVQRLEVVSSEPVRFEWLQGDFIKGSVRAVMRDNVILVYKPKAADMHSIFYVVDASKMYEYHFNECNLVKQLQWNK